MSDVFAEEESRYDAGLSIVLVKFTGDSGFKMALGSYPKLVMMTGLHNICASRTAIDLPSRRDGCT